MRLSAEQVKQAHAMASAKGVAHVAARLGVSETSLRRAFKRLGLPSMGELYGPGPRKRVA